MILHCLFASLLAVEYTTAATTAPQTTEICSTHFGDHPVFWLPRTTHSQFTTVISTVFMTYWPTLTITRGVTTTTSTLSITATAADVLSSAAETSTAMTTVFSTRVGPGPKGPGSGPKPKESDKVQFSQLMPPAKPIPGIPVPPGGRSHRRLQQHDGRAAPDAGFPQFVVCNQTVEVVTPLTLTRRPRDPDSITVPSSTETETKTVTVTQSDTSSQTQDTQATNTELTSSGTGSISEDSTRTRGRGRMASSTSILAPTVGAIYVD